MNSGCSHPCSCGGLDRRHFLKLTSSAALGLLAQSPWRAMAGPFEPEATADHHVPVDKKLRPEWVRALFDKGAPDWYAGDDLRHIGMPVGGIGAGQLYLAGDGRLVHWDIFNDTPEDSHAGTHYQTFPTPVERVQQGFMLRVSAGGKTFTRALDRAGFPGVRFRGEYPIGLVEYAEPDFPVAVSMQAFSPFIPLNAADSAIPVTLLQFTVRNTGKTAADVELAGCLQNAVCCRSGAFAEGIRDNALERQGDFSLVLGSARSTRKPTAPARPPVVLADFEQGTYGDWKIEGEAFGTAPATGTLRGQQVVSGFLGKGLVNTFIDGDRPHGKLTSPEFTLDRPFLNFLIGGGAHEQRTCINLRVAGKVVRSAVGRNHERLVWQSWSVKEFTGARAQIEIVDVESGGWGHINIDQIELSDEPRRGDAGPLEAQPDFGTMGLAMLGRQKGDRGAAQVPGGDLAAWMGSPGRGSSAGTVSAPFETALVGALSRSWRLRPGAEARVVFAVSWHFPNLPQHGNHYGKRFKDARAVTAYVARNLKRLSGETRLWRDTWYDSTLPCWLLDRLFAPVSILASATCQWWANGRFWAWEGVRCCAGTCAHVWNYEHALARLFPELERSVREMQDFGPGFVEATGAIQFRGESNDFWAGDSQGGTVLKCLREHQMSADSAFLKRNWPRIRRTIEFLIAEDKNADGLIEGSQHNTYDINFFGPNTMVGSLYLGGLRAAEVMAREVGDAEFADKCRRIADAGSRLSVERLYNGEYFIQIVDLKKHPDHQYADGCLADQLFGQGWAHQVGLGYLYPQPQVRSALKAIWAYNWAPDIGPQNAAHPPQRWFARPGEAGLFTCTWPKSKHLGPQSVLYRDEIWTGIEYQVAGHMAWEGMLLEALAICRGVHERYLPARQNPWNEVECGDHYARAMASYGVFLGLCGFEYRGPEGHLGFAPRLRPENFKAAFTAAEGWGTLAQQIEPGSETAEVEVKWGRVPLRSLALELPADARVSSTEVTVGRRKIGHTIRVEGRRLVVLLEREQLLEAGRGAPIRCRVKFA